MHPGEYCADGRAEEAVNETIEANIHECEHQPFRKTRIERESVEILRGRMRSDAISLPRRETEWP